MPVDIAGTTVTGGNVVMDMSGGSGPPNNYSLSEYKIILAPGDTLTCAARAEATTINARGSLSWQEEL